MRAPIALIGLLGVAFLVSACETVPDKIYNPIECDRENSCTDKELKVGVRQFTSTSIKPFGTKSAPDIADPGKRGCGDIMERPRSKKNLLFLPYCSAFLEYQSDAGDRVGRKFESDQLAAIRYEIENSKKPLLIVLYVHGWHHNADIETARAKRDTTANVYKFHHMLARHAYQMGHIASLDRSKEHRQVLGIYVGWRGKSIKNNLLSYFTLSGRGAAAMRVGKGELGDDLKQIAMWMRNADEAHHRAPLSSRMLVYGHSYGGRAVIAALAPRLAEQSDLSIPVLGPGTLVATINPAIGSDALEPLFAAGKTAQTLSNKPHWINIASYDDIATWAHPALAWLGLVGVVDPASPRRYYAVGHGPKNFESVAKRLDAHGLTHVDVHQVYVSSDERRKEMVTADKIAPPERRERLEEKIRTPGLSSATQKMILQALGEFEKGGQADFALPCRLMKDAASMADLGLPKNFPPPDNDRCISEWAEKFVLDGQQSVPLIYHYLDFHWDRFTESPESAHFYRLSATRVPRAVYPAMGHMWTLRTDKSMIDFSEDSRDDRTGADEESPGSLGVHNGYVETAITRMLTELLFDDVLPRQVQDR